MGKKSGGRFGHPCGKAALALDDAGHEYELKTVRGFKALPFTKFGGARDEVKELSGQEDVPILVLDDGEVVTGNRAIVDWAKAHPRA
jgi:glutathione S-transferase